MKKTRRSQAHRDAAPTLPARSETSRPFLPRGVVLAILAVLVAGAVTFAHRPVLEARALCIDDQDYLTANRLVQHPSWESAGRFLKEVLRPSTVGGYYQPLTMISLMLDYAVAGRPDNLRPFHRTSLILHVANTLVIMWLLYALFGRPWIAAAVALLFGVHPMTVETIAWVGERKTLLATFFALPCLLAYVRYARRGGWKSYLACLVLYVLALMSKPTSTPLPLVMLMLDFWPLNRLSRWTVVEKAPFLLTAGVFAIITIVSQGHIELSAIHPLSAGQTFLLICHNLVFYPQHMVWPAHLSSLYPFPEDISLSNGILLANVIVFAAMLLLLLISLRWTRAFLAGWLCFFALLSPTLLNLGYSPSIAWDKYAYLPTFGVLLILGRVLDWLAGDWTRSRFAWRAVALGASLVAAAGMLAISTRHYLREWQTSERHCFYMLRLAPNSANVLNHCGNVLDTDKQYERAIECYTRAIELAPGLEYAYNNRGNTYNTLQRYDLAIQDYDKAIALKPDYATAYCNRANTFSDMGRYDEAVRDYTKAVELKSGYADAYHNRAIAFFYLQKYDQAWADIGMFRRLGGTPDPGLISALTAATGRSE